MEHLYNYLEFLAKAATVVVALLAVIGVGMSMTLRRHVAESGHLEVHRLNDRLEDMNRVLREAFLPPAAFKKSIKQEDRVRKKADKEKNAPDDRRRVYVSGF